MTPYFNVYGADIAYNL